MNKIKISAALLAISLVYSVNASGETMSKSEYKAAKKNIAAEYASARANCRSLARNAWDICEVEAKGREKVAKAELEARYKPSRMSDYKVGVAMAKADYTVAMKKCHAKSGNDKLVCKIEAEGAMVRAKSDAMAEFKKSKAAATAIVK